MNKSDSIINLAAALVKAQANIGGAVKLSNNPHFKSSFANLGDVIIACKAALATEGIAVSQLITTAEGGSPALETILIHSSGEWMSATMPVICAKQNDPQAFGSAVTYSRRYSLQSALLIPAVDDDGEAAMFRAQPANQPDDEGFSWEKDGFPNGNPGEVKVHVGMNKGHELRELNPAQRNKLVSQWQPEAESQTVIPKQDAILIHALSVYSPR